ncbi:nitrile hydratase accessory protein [Rhizobium pisi]
MTPRLRMRDGEPPFLEPWHAQAMAMADLLVKPGQVSSKSWAEALGAQISASAARGAADNSEAYFGAVLSALERLLANDGKVSAAELHEREHAWEEAYLRTPHGQPVKLG